MSSAIDLRRNDQPVAVRAGNLEPQSFAECARLAQYVAKSGLFAVKTEEQAMMVMLTGASLGLSPVAALRGVHVIQGKATLDATLVSALVQNHPDCEYWRVAENTNERCTIETKRRSHRAPVTRTWTIDDAKRAGLTNKDTWKAYPAAMLRARCTTDLARACYGDAMFGVYSAEELEPTPREEASQVVAAPVTVTVSQEPSQLAAYVARVTEASSVELLRVVAKDAAKAFPKGSADRAAFEHALHARRAEIEAAAKAPESGEHEAERAYNAAEWTVHIAGIKSAQHLANSTAKNAGGWTQPDECWTATLARFDELGVSTERATEMCEAAKQARGERGE